MSKKQKLTPWFPGRVKPARIGLYQRDYEDNTCTDMPDFWDGKNWILCVEFGEKIGPATSQRRPWRGLAVKP